MTTAWPGVSPRLTDAAIAALHRRRAEAAAANDELTDAGIVYAVFDAIRDELGGDALGREDSRGRVPEPFGIRRSDRLVAENGRLRHALTVAEDALRTIAGPELQEEGEMFLDHEAVARGALERLKGPS